MKVRIFRQPKSAMQSGRARVGQWVLEFDSSAPKQADPLTGWAGSGDTLEQIRIIFPDCDAAVAYANSRGLDYEIAPTGTHLLKLQAYADNFR